MSGVNEKVAEARDRKQGAKKAAAAAQEKANEDAHWDAHANPKAKRDTKKEELVSCQASVGGRSGGGLAGGRDRCMLQLRPRVLSPARWVSHPTATGVLLAHLQERQREEAARKKAEAKKLAEKEEAELAALASKKKAAKPVPTKVGAGWVAVVRRPAGLLTWRSCRLQGCTISAP